MPRQSRTFFTALSLSLALGGWNIHSSDDVDLIDGTEFGGRSWLEDIFFSPRILINWDWDPDVVEVYVVAMEPEVDSGSGVTTAVYTHSGSIPGPFGLDNLPD